MELIEQLNHDIAHYASAECTCDTSAGGICEACSIVDTLNRAKGRIDELEQHRHGHLPTCAGVDPAARMCDCGYL